MVTGSIHIMSCEGCSTEWGERHALNGWRAVLWKRGWDLFYMLPEGRTNSKDWMNATDAKRREFWINRKQFPSVRVMWKWNWVSQKVERAPCWCWSSIGGPWAESSSVPDLLCSPFKTWDLMMLLMCFLHWYVVTRYLACVTYSYFFPGANFLAVPYQSVVVNGN